MENYHPEGRAKSHEKNGKERYSQGTEVEPNQGNLPPVWVPSAMDHLFLFLGLLGYVEWGYYLTNTLSSLPHLYEEFLTF